MAWHRNLLDQTLCRLPIIPILLGFHSTDIAPIHSSTSATANDFNTFKWGLFENPETEIFSIFCYEMKEHPTKSPQKWHIDHKTLQYNENTQKVW